MTVASRTSVTVPFVAVPLSEIVILDWVSAYVGSVAIQLSKMNKIICIIVAVCLFVMSLLGMLYIYNYAKRSGRV